MARNTLSAELIDVDGLVATYTAANADGHAAAYRRDLVLHVVQGTGARDVTVITPGNVSGLAVADRTITVAEDTEAFIWLGDPNYRDGDNQVKWDYDATTNTTVAVLRVNP